MNAGISSMNQRMFVAIRCLLQLYALTHGRWYSLRQTHRTEYYMPNDLLPPAMDRHGSSMTPSKAWLNCAAVNTGYHHRSETVGNQEHYLKGQNITGHIPAAPG